MMIRVRFVVGDGGSIHVRRMYKMYMYKAIQQGIPIYPITANNNNDDTYYTIRDDYTITAIIIEMRPLL